MKYLLRKLVSGRVPEIDITETQYSEYKNAVHILSNCLAIEEKYEIVISNYVNFEKQILDVTAAYMVREHIDYSDFFQVRLGLNILLVNLLTAARLYVDQLPHKISAGRLPCGENAKDIIKGLFSKEYDEHSQYRFMEALRNYVQNIQGSQCIGLNKDGGGLHMSLMVFWSMTGTYFGSQRVLLEEDGEFKKTVLYEIDEKVDLKSATRCYIECISNVHCAAREMIEYSANTSRKLLEDAHKQYSEVYDGSLVGLSACATSDERQISSVSLLLDWDDIRLRLIKRNRKMVNLRKRYVTGRIEEGSGSNLDY